MAALCAITFIAYFNSLNLGAARDGQRLLNDPRTQAITGENLRRVIDEHYWFPLPNDKLYRPVTLISVMLDGGPHHAVNVALHALNACLFFALAWKLLAQKIAAFFAAALWAVHPLTTEVVDDIAGRSDLLATAAILGGLLIYARMNSGDRRTWAWAAALFAVSTLGVFSKESAAILIALMVLWDLTASPRDWRAFDRSRIAAYGAVALSLVVMFVARMRVFATAPAPLSSFVDNPLIGASFWSARLTALKVLGMDLWLMIWPRNLSCDRSYSQIVATGAQDMGVWIATAAIIALLVALWLRRSDKTLLWCAGFAAIAILPTANLVILIGSIMAERFLYVPLFGFIAAAVLLLFRWQNGRARTAILAITIVLCGARTIARNPQWNDNLSLATADLKSAPNSFRLHQMVGEELFARNGKALVDQAIDAQEKAWSWTRDLPADRDYLALPLHLGMFYLAKSDAVSAGAADGRPFTERALAALLRAREIAAAKEAEFDATQLANGKPLNQRIGDPDVYFQLGVALMRLGRVDEAIEAARSGLDLAPSNSALYELLAALYRQRNDSRGVRITLHERITVEGAVPALFSQLQQAYAGEECAFRTEGQTATLNPQCPAVQENLCSAWQNLRDHLERARFHQNAEEIRKVARDRGCADAPR